MLLSTPGWKLIATWWVVALVGSAATAKVPSASLPLAIMLASAWLLYPVWVTFLVPGRVYKRVAFVAAAIVAAVFPARTTFGFTLWLEAAAMMAAFTIAGSAAAALRVTEVRAHLWKPFDSLTAVVGLLLWPLFGGLVHERLRAAHSHAAA